MLGARRPAASGFDEANSNNLESGDAEGMWLTLDRWSLLADVLMPHLQFLENYSLPTRDQGAAASSPWPEARPVAPEEEAYVQRAVSDLDRMQRRLVHWWWCFAKVSGRVAA